MAYSDYGGCAFRNGFRIENRSDAEIAPDGEEQSTPGLYPGFAAYFQGGEKEIERRKDWIRGHAILGDGSILVALYKQTGFTVHREGDQIDVLTLIKDLPEEAVDQFPSSSDGTIYRYLNCEYFIKRKIPIFIEIDNHLLEIHMLDEDNTYQYAKLTQPDGTVWHGFSGYGVGAGFEDGINDYGYNTKDRINKLLELWPDSIYE